MSKLIVDMPMPMCCDSCPLLDDIGDYPICRATQETRGYNFDTRNKKMDKCPICGVLPDEHGDLIDRTLLYADLVGVILSHSGLNFSEVIMRQNAVIAAERKDDGQ
jgi:hypothetical protein